MQPLTALVGALAGKISIVPPVTPRKPLGWGPLLISAPSLPNFKESARGLSVRSCGSWGPDLAVDSVSPVSIFTAGYPRRRIVLTLDDGSGRRRAPPGKYTLSSQRYLFLRPGLCGQGARGPHRVRRHASYFPSQNTPAVRGGDGHQFRAFEKSTSYGDVRTRNWLTVPSHRPVSPFATESS